MKRIKNNNKDMERSGGARIAGSNTDLQGNSLDIVNKLEVLEEDENTDLQGLYLVRAIR